MTTRAANILIRKCTGFEEYDACVRLQTDIWGYDARDTIPQREFIVIQHIGGQVIGAFDLARSAGASGDGSSMIGFAMAMPGVSKGEAYLHSHMLAVLPEYRNLGIGRQLKLAQREDALARGIRKMEWTFDPLEIKNAYLNIVRLGALVHSYTPNFYGVFSSRLQAGLPADRLHAEWFMDSPRVQAALDGGEVLWPEIQETITVPRAIDTWKRAELARAEAVQSEIRERFLSAFKSELAVVGFKMESRTGELHPTGGDGIYLLAKASAV